MLSSRVLERRTPRAPVETNENPGSYIALAIVDGQARIRFSYWNGTEGKEIRAQICEDETTFRPDFREMVVTLVRKAGAGDINATIALRDCGKSMRLAPLVGDDGTLFALVLESDRDDGAMRRAASRFQLTKRQTEVLALILGGASASDVARTLMISEYTAQGYVKCLLAKTNSRNRAAMVAKVLDWKVPRAGEREVSLAIAR